MASDGGVDCLARVVAHMCQISKRRLTSPSNPLGRGQATKYLERILDTSFVPRSMQEGR